MKTMEELILDRLIEEATRPLRIELEKAKIDISVEIARGNALAQTYRDAMSALERETMTCRKLRKDAAEAEGPISDFYKAASKVRMATHGKISDQLREAISQMGSAMAVAEKYIDQIPF
jgi:hypothetical protein